MSVLAAFFLLLLTPLPASLDIYAGEYVLIPSESADIRKVVEDTAAKLNFLIRPIARSRLRKTQIAFPAIRISRQGDEFRIAHDGGTDVAHRTLEDPVSTMSPDGSKIVVRLQPGPPLEQSYESSEGARINRYRLSDDRSKLTVEVHISSERLPSPIEYRLVYKRK